MKRFFQKLTVFSLCLCTMLSTSVLTACGNEVKAAGFELGHYDAATAENGALDSDYFYRNDLNVIGGDADVEWVPEERDPVYGGYYYMWTSGNIGSGVSWYWKDTTPYNQRSASSREEAAQKVDHKSDLTCHRSKDLNDWELVGAVDRGNSVYIEGDSWIMNSLWAPEVQYDEVTNKYYMYFTALSYSNPDGMSEDKQYAKVVDSMFDTFYIAIFESETPVGPFTQVESESYYADLTYEQMNDAQKATYDATGKKSNLNGKILTHQNPTINPRYDLGLDEVFAIIDLSPFRDEDGTLYLAFARHASTAHSENCSWMMRMKDNVTPDYESITMVGACNYEYVTDENVGTTALERLDESKYTRHNPFFVAKNGNLSTDAETWNALNALYESTNQTTVSYPNEDGVQETWVRNNAGEWTKDGWFPDYTVTEGMYLWKEKGRYFYTYSPQGYAAQNYDARQCITFEGETTNSQGLIFGPYHKLPKMPGAIMSRSFGDYINEQMSGTGHHAFVRNGDELFCIYYAHADPYDGWTSGSDGRFYAFDRVVTYEDPTYGWLMAGKGPTQTVQYKPTSYTGLKNVAPQATVTATNCDENTIKYLNDDFFVVHEYFTDREFVAKGATTITMKFAEPVTISALLVYNTMVYDEAFAQIDLIQFKLASAPDWIDQKYASLTDCYIKDLAMPGEYADSSTSKIRSGATAAASFNEIKVSEISFTVSKKVSDFAEDGTIRISDIVVLGR